MKKIILNFVFLCFVFTSYGQSELYLYNASPDRVYVIVNYHELPITGCDVDAAPPAVCLLPSSESSYFVPAGYVVHSARVFNANSGCLISEVDWTLDGHLIFPPFPCSPATDFVPYTLTLTSCGINCAKLLIN